MFVFHTVDFPVIPCLSRTFPRLHGTLIYIDWLVCVEGKRLLCQIVDRAPPDTAFSSLTVCWRLGILQNHSYICSGVCVYTLFY